MMPYDNALNIFFWLLTLLQDVLYLVEYLVLKQSGLLSAAGSVGSIFACVYLSLRRQVLGLERLMAFCPVALGIGLIAFGLSRKVWLSLLILVVVGGGGMLLSSCVLIPPNPP